ncbi:TetR/AcrR family transcriptional regulator, partial [Clostridium sporogenes]
MPKKTFFYLQKEKQDRIIDSAILQFSKVHYNKVTIDSIVEGAKIPKGSFYQYFK